MAKLRICMIHGYLLTGTGSNIFVSNLVRNFCRLGYEVLLVCQERHPQELDFVAQHSVFEPSSDQLRLQEPLNHFNFYT